MAKYHISEDGNPRICRASSPESCPVKGVDGQPASHGDFASDKDARAFAEQVLERHLSGTASTEGISKKSKDADRIIEVDESVPVETALPDMQKLYDEAPRSTIGVARQYAHLKGVQRDLDAGLIDAAGARSRIAALVETLDEMAVWDRTASTEKALAYRERLAELAGDAKPFKPLSTQPEWKPVLKDLMDYSFKVDRSTDTARRLRDLEQRIRGNSYGHEGYSEELTRGLAQKVLDSSSRAKSAEGKRLAASLSAALGPAKN